MEVSFILQWWMIPTLIFIGGMIWAIFFVDSGDGWFAGITNLFALIPVLFVSLIAFIIAGALK